MRSHINGDGSETPVVDVYFRHRNGWVDRLRSMRVYLNTGRDRAHFEATFGVSLDTLNIYDGDTPIERGKRPQQERFIYEPSHPVWAVWRLNPASESDEQAPKRLFVRWETAGRQQSRKPQRPEPRPRQEPQAEAKEAPQPQEQGGGNGDGKRYHFASAPIVAAVSRAWGGLPPAKVVPALYAAFEGKGEVELSVAEALAWAKKNRPQPQTA
ncbi:MAG TPA: hypothetical protein G4O04_03760 [Anaerolineae bacterium]|nr:hypothetical protein [Anaerolineae bacterium]HID84110.1 hypothetical protein [Anaerolineales bacterium]HIQ08634.1 hypothetical protein [Anaerolineaceae bacterium]